jgi:hypothetical protein
MGNSKQSSGEFQLNTTPMIVGVALIAAGGMIGLAGVIIGGNALLSATRSWLRELEVPPTEVVKQKWDQTKAATTAGATAWHQHHHNGLPTGHRARG